MPIALTGEVGTNDVTLPDWATGTVPTNGDDVDAPVIITLVQRLLNNDADIADFAAGTYAQTNATLTSTGVTLIRNVADIAALKAISTSGLPDAAVCVVKDPTITGNTISRLGLFVYDSSSSTAECPIPGIVDGYIVVTPNSGSGRWFNVAAGLGWKLGSVPEFLPKPRERVVRWQIVGPGGGSPSVSLVTSGWTQLAPVLAPVLGSTDDFDYDFDLTMGNVGPMDNSVSVRVEVSYNGGSFAPVPSSQRTFTTSAATTLDLRPIHIGGRISASSGSGTYTLRVFARCNSFDADLYVHTDWTARGVQYVAA